VAYFLLMVKELLLWVV